MSLRSGNESGIGSTSAHLSSLSVPAIGKHAIALGAYLTSDRMSRVTSASDEILYIVHC